ncbi:MAG: hypothetical protein LBN95_02950 [Prevotellaceae bacterium]|nr:hypothetical protein [Prevotellaceae bacterium]
MKKYFVLMFLAALSFSSSTLKANSAKQLNPFDEYNFQQTETPLPSSEANPFLKSNDYFYQGAQLRDSEDGFATGADNDDDCAYVDGCAIGNGVGILVLLIAAYSALLFIRKKQSAPRQKEFYYYD